MIMNHLVFFFYTIGIHLGNLYIWTVGLFRQKMQLLRKGRLRTLKLSNQELEPFRYCFWMHCASLGEFEQGRPLLEALREKYPHTKIVLTFFSPSGYEIRKNFGGADLVLYLPSDLPFQSKKLITCLRPRLFITVKYEFWWNLLQQLKKQGVPTMLIAGIFRKEDYFFHPIARPFLEILRTFSVIFVQDAASRHCLEHHRFQNVQLTGDTRIDRVIQMKQQAEVSEDILRYTAQNPVVVYGSVWPSDMDVVNHTIREFPHFCHLVVPHDIHSHNVEIIRGRMESGSSVYTRKPWTGNVLVADTVGMLASLYSIARIAYIGGGYGRAIHNTLEPAVFGIPVYMGPKHKKFAEAAALKQLGVAISLKSPGQMAEHMKEMEEKPEEYHKIKQQSEEWFTKNKGATAQILTGIEQWMTKQS